MKKNIKFFNFGVAALLLVIASAIPTLAQDDPVAAECNTTYEKFLAIRKEKPEAGYELAKGYLQKCSGKAADIEKFVKTWVEKFELLLPQVEFTKAFAANDFPNIYKYGKQLLARDPENLDVIIKMGFAGFNAEKAKTTAYRGESAVYAKMAIEKIEAAKAPAEWAPFKDKNDALSYLYYTLGSVTKDSAPKDSVKYFYKITKIETPLKSDASTYSQIAGYYQGEYLKKVEEVKVKCPEGAPDSEECKLLDSDVNARLDRWADALARAISYSKNQAEKDAWTKTLTEIFKQRYNKPEAVTGYVANIQKTPMPDPDAELKPAPIMDVTAATAANTTGAITTTTGTETSMGPTPNQTTSTESNSKAIAKVAPKAPTKAAHKKGKSKRP